MSAFDSLANLIVQEAESRESYTVSELAEAIAKGHPRVVSQWVKEAQFTLLTQFVGDHLRHIRHDLRKRKQALEEGWSIFDQDFTISEENVRKRLGDMTGKDHLYVASCYGREARSARIREDLHRLIAKKVGSKKTQDVFTEEQLISLFGNYAPDTNDDQGQLAVA